MESDTERVLDLVAGAAPEYLASLAGRPVHDPAARALLDDLGGPLPEEGLGAPESVAELLRIGTGAATHSSGPRFFHLVVGGVTRAGAGRARRSGSRRKTAGAAHARPARLSACG